MKTRLHRELIKFAWLFLFTDINECDSNPCQNGATCANEVNKYTCSCAAGYTDINCDTCVNCVTGASQ